MDNAVKFTAKNGKIKIKLGRLDKENFFFSIADDGPGISQSDLPFIFDRFYQADKSRSRKSNKGSGLGLAIDKQIIDNYNGTIEIESSEKEGTKFIVKLPLKEK